MKRQYDEDYRGRMLIIGCFVTVAAGLALAAAILMAFVIKWVIS